MPSPTATPPRYDVVALASHVPTWVYWGPEFVEIADDAAITRSTPGAGPAGLARSAGAAWTDTASAPNPERVRLEYVSRTGETVRTEHTAFATERDGAREAVTTTRSYAPLLDPAAPHGVGGVLTVTTVTGTTEHATPWNPDRLRDVPHLTARSPGRTIALRFGNKRCRFPCPRPTPLPCQARWP